METEKKDIYATVTNQIVTAIEAGVGKWTMPWHTSGKWSESPINVNSKKPYRGINTLVLWSAAQAKGYPTAEWGTYNQWFDKGAQVRKGEKSTMVVFWKFQNETKENQDGGTDKVESKFCFARAYAVFNAAQVDNYTPKPEPVRTVEERIASAETWFASIGADIRYGSNRAYYSPMDDYIQMPMYEQFFDNKAFYSTLAHELTHWTGKESRIDRNLSKRFGESAYAMEELVAELGAAFTCAHLGLTTEPREDHAQYLQHWLKVLKADKHAIFTAASKAQQATDYLIAQAEKEKTAAA